MSPRSVRARMDALDGRQRKRRQEAEQLAAECLGLIAEYDDDEWEAFLAELAVERPDLHRLLTTPTGGDPQ